MRWPWRWFALTGCVLVAPTASAQVRAGGEFRVNTYTTGWQNTPALAGLPDGGFVAVWKGYLQSPISGQRLDAAGQFRGGEFQVSDETSFGAWPDVASDRRGRFVVAWEGPDDILSIGIFARRFDSAGAALGGAFAVNTTTAGYQLRPAVAMQRGGAFVVVWMSELQDGSGYGVFGRRYDGAGRPLGAEFQANTFTPQNQLYPSVAADELGRFVVAWESYGQDGDSTGIFAQRFQADGTRAGAEFQVNVQGSGFRPHVLPAPDGGFVVTWRDAFLWSRRFDSSGAPQGPDVLMHALPPAASFVEAAASARGEFAIVWDVPSAPGPVFDVAGRRFDVGGVGRGAEFRVNTSTGNPGVPIARVGSDSSGNLLVTWVHIHPVTFEFDIFGQRYGGLVPASLTVAAGNNGVLEPGEPFTLLTSWRNVNGAPQTFAGRASEVVAPSGLTLSLSLDASYGTLANGATGSCVGPCFAGALSGARPSGHVDASFLERIVPDAQGQSQKWLLHVGESFADVPRTSAFYGFVEALLHHDVTAGCGADAYCPAASTTREQMSTFVLVAKEGAGYVPPACTTPMFADVPASSPFCRWIEELARRGVTGGCGGGNYCPTAPVSREQMAVFVLRTLDPNLNPPACTTPIFNDVPASSPFCPWIEELARRGIVTGCAQGLYCPTAPVTREQMAVFLTGTFGLTLYGP